VLAALSFVLVIRVWASNTEQVLYTFTGHKGGGLLEAGLVFDKAGNLYGTTVWGGNPGCSDTGCGTVFELRAKPGGGWAETVIYAFKGDDDGYAPQGTLIFDDAGNLYGTTTSGGRSSACTYSLGCGTVFELQPVAGGWQKTTLYNFAGNGDASTPVGPLVLDQSGDLYGTTFFGGAYPCNGGIGCGTIFELKRLQNRAGGWDERVLYSFAGGADGISPTGGVILKGANLYGTTEVGGGTGCYGEGCGTVFELSWSNGKPVEKVLYAFTGATDGAFPEAGLTADANGQFYGTASQAGDDACGFKGGFGGCGTVFSLVNSGGGWGMTVIHSFSGGNDDGLLPLGGITLNGSKLYGMTSAGGGSGCAGYGCGIVFELAHSASGWTQSVLWSFDGSDGANPFDNVVFDGHGNLYGATSNGGSFVEGNVFELSP
jgi:hypothetical protein